MKAIISNRIGTIFSAALLTLALAVSAFAADKTAFDLVKDGNKYVSEESKDKVVQIRSEKSFNGTSPATWYVVYYEPKATLKAVEVKFVSGNMVEVKRPLRLLEPISDRDEPLLADHLKIDSDKALKIVLKEPLLEGIKPTAVKYKLDRFQGVPVWKIDLWAASVKNPAKEKSLGDIWVDTKEGKIVQSRLKINKAE